MSFGGPEFVLAIIALSTFGWVITSWIRAKHGYPVENEWGGSVGKDLGPDASHRLTQLTAENGELRALSVRLGERIEVLERIATDPAARTAREIEDLRGSK
jgi:hypothetical protein